MTRTLGVILVICAAMRAASPQEPAKPVVPLPAAAMPPPTEATLLDSDGQAVANVNIVVKIPIGQDIRATTATDGKFTGSLPVGTYQIFIRGKDLKLNTTAAVATLGQLQLPMRRMPISPTEDCQECSRGSIAAEYRWLAAALLGLYWTIVIVARYHNIFKVNQALLLAAVRSAEQEVAAVPDDPLGVRASVLLEAAHRATKNSLFLPFFFGMRGQLAGAWAELSEALRILSGRYTRDQVLVRLRTMVVELRPEYSNIAESIEAVLQKTDDPTHPVSDEFVGATLQEGLRALNEKKQSALTETLNWQNKAFTLIFIGCCLVIALAAILDNSILLLVGFVGGFASRLLRGKSSPNAAVDAELSWTTLFLSPIYGAFAGWAGILLLAGLKHLQLLGDKFTVEWNDPCISPVALALAFLFGFSERYFSAITDLAQKAVLKSDNAKAADAPLDPKAPVRPSAGIPKNEVVRKAPVPVQPPSTKPDEEHP